MKSIRQFLARSWQSEEAVRVQKALTERLDTLYAFVRIAGTSWNSNDAELEERVAVTHRNNRGRSEDEDQGPGARTPVDSVADMEKEGP